MKRQGPGFATAEFPLSHRIGFQSNPQSQSLSPLLGRPSDLCTQPPQRGDQSNIPHECNVARCAGKSVNSEACVGAAELCEGRFGGGQQRVLKASYAVVFAVFIWRQPALFICSARDRGGLPTCSLTLLAISSRGCQTSR